MSDENQRRAPARPPALGLPTPTTSHPPVAMDSQTSNVEGGKAKWPAKHHKIWVDICLDLVQKGKRPGSTLDKFGYEILIKEFNKRTGLSYNRQQLKNHWDRIKGEWARWTKLLGNTGLGWHTTKETIVADDEWWGDWLKKYPKDEKWRVKGLEFASELDVIFGGTIATGDLAYAPSQNSYPFSSTTEHMGTSHEHESVPETQVDQLDDDELVEVTTPPTRKRASIPEPSSSQRRKLSGPVKLGKQIDRLCDAVEFRSTATSVRKQRECITVADCIKLLDGMENVTKGTHIYLFAVTSFMKKEVREVFTALDGPELRLIWLEHMMTSASTGGH